MKQTALLIIPALLLSGCAASREGDFPSLAKRPFETVQTPDIAPVIADASPVAVPIELDAKISLLERRVQSSQAAFQRLLPSVRRKASAARGSKVNSESWIAAHLQLSRLDQTRADAIAATVEMDRLVTQELNDNLQSGSAGYDQKLINRQQEMGDVVRSQGEIIDTIAQTIGI